MASVAPFSVFVLRLGTSSVYDANFGSTPDTLTTSSTWMAQRVWKHENPQNQGADHAVLHLLTRIFLQVAKLTDLMQTHAHYARIKVEAPSNVRLTVSESGLINSFLFRWRVLLSRVAAANIRDPLHKSRHPEVQSSDSPKQALTLRRRTRSTPRDPCHF